MIYMVVACTTDYLIGTAKTKNQIPWENKEDLAHFKQTILHKTLLMGRKTFDAIGKSLPQRTMLVLSKRKQTANNNRVVYVDDLKKIMTDFQSSGDDLYVCGGKAVYEVSLPYVDIILLSRIPGQYQGEVYLSNSWLDDFQLVTKIPRNTFELEIYRRKIYV